tara:strand:- start:6 stop:875 length:870 start_codon:yes stop_codon:yes gene_type:complete
MPVYKRDNKKIHFIHPPKTGGMSVRALLESNGWNRISEPREFCPGVPGHGHAPYKFWSMWDETKNVDFEFSIIRNPTHRVISHLQMTILHQFDRAAQNLLNMGASIDNEDFISFFEKIGFHDIRDMPDHLVLDKIDRIFSSRWNSANTVAKINYGYVWLEENLDKDLEDSSWPELIDLHLTDWTREVGEDFETVAAVPCPLNLYTSQNTRVYRLESDIKKMISDLKDLGFIHLLDDMPNKNKEVHRFTPGLFSSWDDFPDIKKRFFNLYDRDFEIFNYDKSTPFPEIGP